MTGNEHVAHKPSCMSDMASAAATPQLLQCAGSNSNDKRGSLLHMCC